VTVPGEGPSASPVVTEARGDALASFDLSNSAALRSVTATQSVASLPSVSAAVAAAVDTQARPTNQTAAGSKGGGRTPSSPESQLVLQATKFVSAALDPDDSVTLVEVLAQVNAGPATKKEPAPRREHTAPASPERASPGAAKPSAPTSSSALPATPDRPGALLGLVQQLAAPAVVTAVAAGWVWHRVRCRQGRKLSPAA
jgi:hypothetical protein